MNINAGSVSVILALKLCATLAFMAFASFGASGRPEEEQFRIPAGSSSLKLFLRHLAPADGGSAREGRVVLILHGGTLPSGASSAFRFDGHSWMDDLSEAGSTCGRWITWGTEDRIATRRCRPRRRRTLPLVARWK